MKSREQIEIDFLKASDKATELEEIAGQLSSLANSKYQGALSMLRANWSGENADYFAKKSNALTEDIYSTAQELVRVASNIRRTAEIVYKAEKAATMICY